MTCNSVREVIPSLLDGELDSTSQSDIQNHLQGCVDCAEVHHELEQLRTTILADAPYYSAPRELRSRVLASVREIASGPRSQVPWAWVSAAAVAGFAAAMLVVMVVRPSRTIERNLLAQEVVSSHVRALMASHLIDVPSSDRHTVKPWFAGKLDFSPAVKDLSDQGFQLVGGRLDYISHRPVAAIVYQRRLHMINLFVWPVAGSSAGLNSPLAVNGFNALNWSEGGLAYWAVSDLNARELDDFSKLYRK